jgi:hypothetical protein
MHVVRGPKRGNCRWASTNCFASAADILQCLSHYRERRSEMRYTALPRGTHPGLAGYGGWEPRLGRHREYEAH